MTTWSELWAKPERPPVDIQPLNGHANGGGYGQAALAAEVEELLQTGEGSRNDRLNRAVFSLAQLVASGHLDQADVTEQLRAAALRIGLEPTEIEATLRSGQRAGLQLPRQVKLLDPIPEVGILTVVPSDTEGEAPERTSWWPEPITERAARTHNEPAPTHLRRDDGKALLYSGKVNGLIGESESGKSWVALLAAVQAVQGGQRVLILDFEDSPDSVARRLRELGCTDAQLALVDYANPDEALGILQANDLREALANTYAVIIADGVNAAMTVMGYDINSNTDATAFAAKFLRPLSRTGACVITVDHVPKNPETRGKGGIGAQAKRAMMDGTCLSVEVVEPFGRGQSGTLKLTVDKDRNGAVRGISGGGKHAGRAHLDSVGGHVTIRIDAPDLRSDDERPAWRPTGLMEKVSRLLERAEQPMSGNEIYEAVHGRKQIVLQAIAELVAGGHVVSERRSGRGGGDAYRSTQIFREDGPTDLDSNRFPTGSQPVPGTGSELVPTHPLPYGVGTGSTEPVNQFGAEVVPEPLVDLPAGHTSCNHCGQPTIDTVIRQTGGYCGTCWRNR